MRNRLWLIAAGYVTLLSLAAVPAIAQQPAETPAQRTERELDVRTSLEFVDTPLQDVLDYVQEAHGVKINLATETMNGESRVDPEVPVTLNVRAISLRSGLHLLLDQHGLEVTVKPDGTLLLVPSTKELKAKRVESEVQKAVHAKLQLKLVKENGRLKFVQTPLKDVLTYLAEDFSLTIALDQRALEKAGISRDERVTCTTPDNQPLSRLLQFVLLPFDLHAIIQDESLLVVPRDIDAEAKPSVAVATALATKFDIDLAQPLPDIAKHLSEKTGVPFVLHCPALTKAAIDMERALVIKEKGVTPAEAIARTKPALPLKLIERDGMVLISVEAKK
ncbi:hypothetical protein NA78x_001194 [Anatilimnocola sp. NA78]|uniref:hypothetical protein n=1 Tax=Anatilimnocola sp. NA78 TaxID=3415683 RepID=UPI003CE51389